MRPSGLLDLLLLEEHIRLGSEELCLYVDPSSCTSSIINAYNAQVALKSAFVLKITNKKLFFSFWCLKCKICLSKYVFLDSKNLNLEYFNWIQLMQHTVGLIGEDFCLNSDLPNNFRPSVAADALSSTEMCPDVGVCAGRPGFPSSQVRAAGR